MSEICVINTRYYPPYADVDEGSARLRVGIATVQKHFPQARINSVIKLRIHISSSKSIIVICTIWPDSEKILGIGEVCVDDAVQVGQQWEGEWLQGKAEVNLLL